MPQQRSKVHSAHGFRGITPPWQAAQQNSLHSDRQEARATGQPQQDTAPTTSSRQTDLPQFQYFLIVSSRFKCIDEYLYVFSLSNKGPKYHNPTLFFEVFFWGVVLLLFVSSCFVLVVCLFVVFFEVLIPACLLPNRLTTLDSPQQTLQYEPKAKQFNSATLKILVKKEEVQHCQ